MDKSIKVVGGVALLLYSVGLLAMEALTSQDHVRHYFTDLRGPVLFYGVNTSLSVFLLAGAALLFLASMRLVPSTRRTQAFDASQAVVFAFLAFDDRFLIHEAIGSRLGIEDALLLLAVGVAQLVALYAGRDVLLGARVRPYLIAAAGCFAAMLALDALAPLDAPLRLSAEDLFKVWGGAMILLYAWETLRSRIAAPPHTQTA